MSKELSYTIEEVAQLLKVSKLTIYDLVKKGELPVFRVGRQMRMDANDLERYIEGHKSGRMVLQPTEPIKAGPPETHTVVISGQDLTLDLLGKQIEKHSDFQTLRSHAGSLNGLISMYNKQCDIVSLHMFDGDTGEYNLPYIKKILVGYPYVLMNLVSRKAGLYVQKGNPHKLKGWSDLNGSLRIVNRERGSGARILLDEQLRLHRIPAKNLTGYEHEEPSHLSVASAVSAGTADVGVGIEKAAKIVGVDFVPLITERYDIVILKTPKNEALIKQVSEILSSESFRTEIEALGDYDISQMGSILHETE